jgi:hypothetical protein
MPLEKPPGLAVDLWNDLSVALEHAVAYDGEAEAAQTIAALSSRYGGHGDGDIVCLGMPDRPPHELRTTKPKVYFELLWQAHLLVAQANREWRSPAQLLQLASEDCDHEMAHAQAVWRYSPNAAKAHFAVEMLYEIIDGRKYYEVGPCIYVAGPMAKIHQVQTCMEVPDPSLADEAIVIGLGCDPRDGLGILRRATRVPPIPEWVDGELFGQASAALAQLAVAASRS